MRDHLTEQLEKHPEWRLLLTAYHARQFKSQDGWVDRIGVLDDFNAEQLSKMHGRLIALGALDFELGGPGDGMRYQVSSQGRQALQVELVQIAAEPDADDDDATPAEMAERSEAA